MKDKWGKNTSPSNKHLILQMDSNKRSGTDRRKQTGINMRMLAGAGVRRIKVEYF